jgi:hypothetical protein
MRPHCCAASIAPESSASSLELFLKDSYPEQFWYELVVESTVIGTYQLPTPILTLGQKYKSGRSWFVATTLAYHT